MNIAHSLNSPTKHVSSHNSMIFLNKTLCLGGPSEQQRIYSFVFFTTKRQHAAWDPIRSQSFVELESKSVHSQRLVSNSLFIQVFRMPNLKKLM